jgi:hypothetical protein
MVLGKVAGNEMGKEQSNRKTGKGIWESVCIYSIEISRKTDDCARII